MSVIRERTVVIPIFLTNASKNFWTFFLEAMTSQQPLYSVGYKFSVYDSCNDVIGTLSKMSIILILKLDVCYSKS
jgi:hypothetical protein